MTAMIERLQNDGTVAKVQATPAPRAELAVSPAPSTSEMREKAVTPVGQGHRSTTDENVLHATHVIGQMRGEFDAIAQADQANDQLEKIFAKIFSGYQAMTQGSASEEQQNEAFAAADQLDEFELDLPGSQSAPSVEQKMRLRAKDPTQYFEEQTRDRTLARIETALRKVGQLREKLGSTRLDAHDRLLNISSSVTGLNMARAQIDDSQFGVYSAASTADAVMVNLRSAVVAHGNVSPEIVRLILN